MTAKILFLSILQHWYILLALWIGFTWLILRFLKGANYGKDEQN